VGIRCADHATPLYPQRLTLTSPTTAVAGSVYFACGLKPRIFFFFGVVSWPRLTFKHNRGSETELGAKAVSGSTSGLNGYIPIDMNPATAELRAALFVQASANNLGN
jgi:hypothetical protein